MWQFSNKWFVFEKFQVMKKILRTKVEEVSTNSGTSNSSNFVRYSDDNKAVVPVSYQTLLNPHEENNGEPQYRNKDDIEIKQNSWFNTFQVVQENEKLVEAEELEEFEQLLEDETLSDEHDELFDVDTEQNEFDDENDDVNFEDDDGDDVNSGTNKCIVDSADDVKLTSPDTVNFYDEEGKFLYRIR